MPEAEKTPFSWRSLAVVLVMVGVFGGLLYLEGRPGWCKYGLTLWTSAWTHCTSQNILDPYSLSHVLHGVIFYWLLRWVGPRIPLRWRLVLAMLIEVAWELIENSPWVIERYRQQTASLDYTGDSTVNSMSDLANGGNRVLPRIANFLEGGGAGVRRVRARRAISGARQLDDERADAVSAAGIA